MELTEGLKDFEREAANSLRRLDSTQAVPYFNRLIKKVTEFKGVIGEISTEQFDHSFLSPSLDFLIDSLDCLRLKHATEGEDRIDFQPTILPFESGFPTFKDFYYLDKDREQAQEVLAQLPTQPALLNTMKWKIKAGEPIAHEQILLKRNLYYSKLLETKTLPGEGVVPGQLEFRGTNNQKRFYAIDWCSLQSSPAVPVFYKMWFTQNENFPALHAEGDKPATPNPKLEDFIQQTKSGIEGLKSFATRLNQSIEEIHPKEVRKYTLGPFYDSVTSNSEQMIKAFEGCQDPSALKFKVELALSVDIRRRVFRNTLEHIKAVVTQRPMEYEIYSEAQLMHEGLIVPTRIKQNLRGDHNEYGNPCRVYGINGGNK